MPLTNAEVKPAVHYGASYRIIDFALSNLLNSGIEKVIVPVQFKPKSLEHHVGDNWSRYIGGIGRFIRLVKSRKLPVIDKKVIISRGYKF